MIAYDLVGLKYYVCRCSTFQVISNPIYFLRHYGVIFCIKLQYKSRAASEHKLKCSWLCHFSWSLLWLINASGAITSRSERPWSSFNQSVSPPDFWNSLHLSAGDEEQLQHPQPAMAACPAPHVPKSGTCIWGEFCSPRVGRLMQKAAPHGREITHITPGCSVLFLNYSLHCTIYKNTEYPKKIHSV